MKKFYLLFVFSLFILLFSPNLSFAQQPLSGKDSPSLQKPQTEELNDFGTLWGWGRNGEGQLGDGTNDDKFVPVQIGKDYKWKVITANIDGSLAIKTDGTLWAWGWNLHGQFGDGTFVSSNIPKRIGDERRWCYVSAGSTHVLAIKSDSSLWAWGGNHRGDLGDSTLVIGQNYPSPIRVEPKTWQDLILISSGVEYSAAIRKGGTLYTWGGNEKGQIGDGTNIYKNYPVKIGTDGEWLSINCDYYCTNAIKKDGTLWAWGDNTHGQLGDGTTIDKNTPVQIGVDNDWASISGAWHHSLALKKDGTLWAWGSNWQGGLGDSTISEVYYPVQIGKENDWVSITVDDYQSTAIKKDGSLWVWGGTRYIKVTIYKIPTKVKDIGDVIRISNNSNCNYTMFIRRHIPTLPEVITLPITAITDSNAVSGGNVTSDGKEWDCVRGICWAVTPNPTINDSITVDGQGVGEYQSSMKYLQPLTQYFVRAYVTNSLGTTYGQNETFWSKLPTPILVSPKNGNYNIPLDVALVWKKVELAKSYRIQIYNSSKIISDVIITDTNFIYNKYDPMTQYDWRVQAINGLDSSYWSDMWNFTTGKYNPQYLITPANDTINIPIDCKFEWKENSANSKYHLQISKKADFSNFIYDTTVAETFFNSNGLDFLNKYFWRVRAEFETDQSEWSSVWKFTTLMDSVNLKTPVDLSKLINIPTAFSWEAGIYKKDYRLQISEAYNFTTLKNDTLISKTANADVKNLNYWQKYFWRVRNESGDTLGYWSQIWQFKTRLGDILLMYPEDTQTGLKQEINFKWYSVVGAEYYQLQISKNEQFTNMVYSKDSITATEKFVPDLEKDILYYWRVRVWNTETIGTAYWSEVWTFRTGETSVQDESEFIQIIPNPAGDFITITLRTINPMLKHGVDETSIIIYNTLGEKVKSLTPALSKGEGGRINISDLPKGIYFVKVGGETAKFVKN
ncbi:MAG: T9SS type A sorting domain-containing protein [bacterium]